MRILFPAKIVLKNTGEIKIFSDFKKTERICY